MVAITYVEHDGTAHTVDVDDGMNLMDGATLNLVPGIEGMCGGMCSCATCHCYVPEEWSSRLPPVSEGEQKLIDGSQYPQANSRLGCQITVSAELEGLVVHLPPEQG